MWGLGGSEEDKSARGTGGRGEEARNGEGIRRLLGVADWLDAETGVPGRLTS